MNKKEIAQLVRPLSPTGARILLVLMLGNGASFQGRELAMILGKTPNTISTAIQELEFLGFAQNNGRNYGWSINLQMAASFLPEIQKNLDDPKKFGLTPLSSSSSDQQQVKVEEEEEGAAEIQINLEIKNMLLAAGIGRRSKMLADLLALDLDEGYVRRHIAAAKDAGDPVSHLICRLRDGDPVPAAPRKRPSIPAELKDIIKR